MLLGEKRRGGCHRRDILLELWERLPVGIHGVETMAEQTGVTALIGGEARPQVGEPLGRPQGAPLKAGAGVIGELVLDR